MWHEGSRRQIVPCIMGLSVVRGEDIWSVLLAYSTLRLHFVARSWQTAFFQSFPYPILITIAVLSVGVEFGESGKSLTELCFSGYLSLEGRVHERRQVGFQLLEGVRKMR